MVGMKDLSSYLKRAREIVRYYRIGPLGDVPAINGKLVEEALRKVMMETGLGKVTTAGLIDLGVKPWGVGLQVKTYRKKENVCLFARSDKGNLAGRIRDIKVRLVNDLKRLGVRDFYMVDVDTLTSDFTVYRLASLKADGTLRTYGSFLKPQFVRISEKQTHFRILKTGLLKVA